MAKQKNHSKKKRRLSILNGGVYDDLARSIRNHPTHKKPKLKLVQ